MSLIIDNKEINMPKCRTCGNSFGLMELKGGICKGCLKQAEDLPDPTIVNEEQNNSVKDMLIISAENFATEKIVKTLGTARGSTVRAKHLGRDFMADIKNIVGGELKGYTELLAEGREEAIYRMKVDAVRMGANAIVCVRFATSTIGAGAAEVFAYGTAVIIKEEAGL